MKAVVINQFIKDPSELTVSTVPTPQPPFPHALRVRVTHACVTHVDMLYAHGLHQNNRRHAKPPFVLGTEFAGVVVAVASAPSAPESAAYPAGTRVLGFHNGTYAEEIWVHETQVQRVPAGWTNAGACALWGSAVVSYGALVGAGALRPGESVLVLGASGGLGVAAIQVARGVGAARVIGLVGDERGDKADAVRRLGAETVSYDAPGGWAKRVLEMTGGEGVDVIYDSVGAVDECLRCVKGGGRVLVVGFAGRGGKMEQIRVNKILLRPASVIGFRVGEGPYHEAAKLEMVREGLMKLADTGKLTPLVYPERYQGLESLPRTMRDVKNRKVWGRAVISVSDEDAQGAAIEKRKEARL